MKLFRNIAIGLAALFIIAITGAYIYFNDARLKSIFLPIASKSLGTEVTASSMSLSLFRHFPLASVEIEGLAFGDTLDKPLKDMESMSFAVKIFPLFSNKLDIAQLQIDKPDISYIVYDDGTTNLDPIMDVLNDTTSTPANQQGWEIELRRIVLNEATIAYDSKPDSFNIHVPALNLDASLHVTDVVVSSFDARAIGMTVIRSGNTVVSNVSLGMEQQSIIDLTNETIALNAGNIFFGDFRLGLTGKLSNWSEALMLDLKLASSSSDFSELLNLLPANLRAQFANYETRGAFNIDGTIVGILSDDSIPTFDIKASIQDGYLKDRNLPTAIENINLRFTATNDFIKLDGFKAKAGVNTVESNGVIRNPLDAKKGSVAMNILADIDLGSVKDFYDIRQSGIELMRGKLDVDADIDAGLSDLASGRFDANLLLKEGYLKYADVARPFEDIRLNGTISNQRILLNEASLRAGTNRVSASGSITQFLGGNPISDITIRTVFNLAEARDFVLLDPQITLLQGQAVSNLTLKGPLYTFEDLHFVGSLDLNNVSVDHDSLPQPITGLQAKLTFTEQQASLNQLKFNIGSSDVDIRGSMSRYMALFSDKPNSVPAELVGNFKSRFLNVDEIYPMSGSADEVILVLPNVNSRLTAVIDSMVVFTSPVTNLNTTLESTSKRIIMRNGSFNLFGGSIRGAFTFDVLNPRASLLNFAGQLKDIRIESFFRDFPVFGKSTRIHEYVSGGVNFDTNYKTVLDSYLNPETATTQAEGSIGMTEVRFTNHPIQIKIADFLGISELKEITLNAWTTNFVIGQSLLNLQDMKITARGFTFELDGSENLITQEISYQARIYMPRRYTSAILGLLPREAVEALVRPDSSIVLPLYVSGTYTNPQVSLNQDAMKVLVDAYVKRQVNSLEEEARQRLQNLFRKKN